MNARTLYCRCAFSDTRPAAARDEALRALLAAGSDVDCVPDLCEMVARRDPDLPQLIADGAVDACRERTVRWLLATVDPATATGKPSFVVRLTGRPAPDRAFALIVALLDAGLRVAVRPAAAGPASPGEWILTAEQVNAETAAQLVQRGRAARDAAGARQIGDWPPWFPVIDRDRCIDCGQCAGFCLFGVYSVAEDGTVHVTSPDHCKNLCPACARACPRLAIVFPKHRGAPIDGSEILPEHFEQQRADLDRLKKQGILDRLRTRRQQAKGE